MIWRLVWIWRQEPTSFTEAANVMSLHPLNFISLFFGGPMLVADGKLLRTVRPWETP
jgi:hypothetical protein